MLHSSYSPPYLPWESKIGLFIFINIMAVYENIGLWCLNVQVELSMIYSTTCEKWTSFSAFNCFRLSNISIMFTSYMFR